MGALGTVSAIGTALGPSLGGLMIPLSGWRGIFWMQMPLAILALVLAVLFLPRDAGGNHAKAGSLWSVMNKSLLLNLVVNVIVAGTMMTTLLVGPCYISLALALPVSQVGVVMAIGPVISIFSGVPAGRLVDAWGEQPDAVDRPCSARHRNIYAGIRAKHDRCRRLRFLHNHPHPGLPALSGG